MTNKDLSEPLLTLKEAELITGLKWRTIYRWTMEGKLAYVQPKANCIVRVRLCDLENLLASKILV